MYGLIYAKEDSNLAMFDGFKVLGDVTMSMAINILLYLGYSVIIVKEITDADSP